MLSCSLNVSCFLIFNKTQLSFTTLYLCELERHNAFMVRQKYRYSCTEILLSVPVLLQRTHSLLKQRNDKITCRGTRAVWKSSFILRWPKLILNNLSRKNKILIIFVRLQDTSLLLSTLDTLLSSTPSTLGTLNKDSIHHLKDNSRPLKTVNGSAQSCLDVMQYFFVNCTSVYVFYVNTLFYSWFFLNNKHAVFFNVNAMFFLGHQIIKSPC